MKTTTLDALKEEARALAEKHQTPARIYQTESGSLWMRFETTEKYEIDGESVTCLFTAYPPLTVYKITRADGTSYTTNCAAGITLEQAKAYFLQDGNNAKVEAVK